MGKKSLYNILIVFLGIFLWFQFTSFKVCDRLIENPKDNIQYIRTNWVEGTNGMSFMIESRKELEEYINLNMQKYGLYHREKVYVDTTIGFVDAIKEYDDKYFKSHNLVLLLLTSESSSINYEVISKTVRDGSMEVDLKRHSPEMITCDMTGWHIIIEIDKMPINKIDIFVD